MKTTLHKTFVKNMDLLKEKLMTQKWVSTEKLLKNLKTKKERAKSDILTGLVKTKTFIYKLWFILRAPQRFIKTLHQNLLNVKDLDLTLNNPRNPYQVFFDWLLETLQYGAVMGLVYMWITTLNFWLMIPALGSIRWLWLDIVKETKRRTLK